MKDTITKSEYQMLLGLQVLGERANEKQNDVAKAISGLIGEEDEYNEWGHEALYTGRSIESILNTLEIEVVDE